MNGTDILERIKKAEEKEDRDISIAEENSRKELDSAKKDADSILEKSNMKEQMEYDRIMSEHKLSVEKELSRLEGEYESSVASLKNVTNKRVMEVFEAAIKKIFGV